MANDSEIKKKYAGKTVFITGGTGFLGKALIEKLLYSCEEISKIYVLVREKKNQTIHERIQQLFVNNKAFERLKERPNCLSKLFPLEGDVRKPNLGISADEIILLEEEVSMVFNLAATVNFKEPFDEALNVNVVSALEVIKLCHRMKRLQSLVHVSTAYSNSELRNVDEIVYPPPHSLEQAQLHISQGSYCLGNKPNTYTYTKALAEDVILKNRGDIPTAIIRPSIVISSLKEPCPGWIDSWNGSTGFFVSVSLGILKVVMGKTKNILDLVPVDIVTNLSIVAAVRCQKSKDLKVYNCCTGSTNPITMREALNIITRITLKYSLNEFPWTNVIMTSSHTVYYFLSIFLHLLPAFVVDVWCFFLGKSRRNIKTQMKLMQMIVFLKYFTLHQWRFSDGNVRELWNLLSKRDQESFNFDVRSIVWEDCIKDYIFGARKFLLKK